MFWGGVGGLTVGAVTLVLTMAGAIEWKRTWPMTVWMIICAGMVAFGRKR